MTNKTSILSILILSCLLALTACQKRPETNKEKADAKPVINAKEVMDKVSTDVESAVGEKIEQMANIDMGDIYNDPDAYLALNAKKPGVEITSSGLQYRILKQGTGAKPTRENTVEVNYRGTFPDGREFDSSYKRGKPAQFPVTRVIKGWTEALVMMNEGTKLELVIPPNLAYGERGSGSRIPPNQVLKFEIELLDADTSD